jgi:hypothetical protein
MSSSVVDDALTRASVALDQAEDMLLSVDEPSAVKYAAAEADGCLDLAARWLRVAWSAMPDGDERDDIILAERAAAGTLPNILKQRVGDYRPIVARAHKIRSDVTNATGYA